METLSDEANVEYVFHVSGFGSFNGVESNPTQIMMHHLEDYLKRQPLNHGHCCRVASVTVYEVSAVGALSQFQSLMFRTLSSAASTPHAKHIFLFFGVNGRAGAEFALERTGWNECSFRVPDERGWQPQLQTIIPTNGTIEHSLKTTLPVERIQELLQAAKFPVIISDDPGRFLCNFILYSALHTARQLHTHMHMQAVFIHVPTFDHINASDQMSFAHALLDAVVAADASS